MRKRQVEVVTSPLNKEGMQLVPVKPAVSKAPSSRPSTRGSNSRAMVPVSMSREEMHGSLISKSERDALTVSAFGFGTTRHGYPERSNDITVKSGHSTAGVDCHDVVVSQSEKDSVRFRLCVEALADGCVSTFIHLFELSHREPVCVDELAQTLFTIPDNSLRWVKEQLAAIEVLRGQSEFHQVFERCQALADYFEAERDYNEAVWHYEVALRFSMESLDRALEQKVRVTLAAFYERHKQYRKALSLYEALYKLAIAIEDSQTALEASAHLMRVYQALGEELMRSNPMEARRFFEKTVAVAQRLGSAKDEALAYNALGNICEQMGNLREALEFQRAFFEVARREGLREDEQRAALSVADLQERMHMSAEAMQSLERALALSEANGDLEGVCLATMQLGQACKSNGDEEKALEYFRVNFQAACQQKNRDLEEQARVALGFALGEHYFTHAGGGRGYVPIVCNDIRAQLEWMSKGVKKKEINKMNEEFMNQSTECASSAALLTKALQLQHTRCETYRLWDTKFHRVLGGTLSAGEFQSALTSSVVSTFQDVNLSLRRLQENIDQGQFLHEWIERVQRLEQEHYRICVLLAQTIVQHCAASPPVSTESSQKQRQSSSLETENTDKVKMDGTEERADTKKQARVIESDAKQTHCIFHDSEHCALRHLIPAALHSSLSFVSCRDASSLGSINEESEYSDDAAADDDGHNNNNKNNDLFVPSTLSAASELLYDPAEVRQRCVAFGAKAMPLWEKRQSVKQQLQEWTDELQAELTDL